MTFSKKAKLLNILLLGILLASCSATVDESKDESELSTTQKLSSQSLVYSSLKIFSTQTMGEDSVTRIATSKFYTMISCFQTANGRKLDQYDFSISGNDFKSQKTSSDQDGCVYWEEEVDLDLTKTKEIFKFQRTFKAEGTGLQTTLNFAIEPNNKDALYDLAKTKIKESANNDLNKFSSEETIVMDQIRFTPKGYGKEDPRNDNNVIDKPFVANTCFNYKSTGQRMAREKIDAYMINQETGRVIKKENFTLNENGCAELSFSMLHERYSNTRRIPFNFIVKTKNPSLKGAYVERGVCLYPWSNSGWVFGHDTISGECPEDSKDQRAKIFLDEINYSFLGHDIENGFHINKDLDLVVVKSYVVNMFPKIDYGNFVHTNDPTEPIYSGKFRLKLIVLAPTSGDIELNENNYSKFRVISATSKIVEVEAKRLKARIDLPIKFSDIPYVYTRTYAVVKLEPVEETDNSLLPGIAAGTFNASSKLFRSILHTQVDVEGSVTKENSNLVELRGFLDNLFSQIKENSNQEIINMQLSYASNKSSEEKFMDVAKTNKEMENFKEYTVNNFNEKLVKKLTKEEIVGLLEDSYTRETMTKLCAAFFDSTEEGVWIFKSYKDLNYKKCLNNPEQMMDMQAFSHIKEITKKPKVSFSNTIRINGSAGSGSYHGTSDRISSSRSIKAGAGLKFDIPVVNIGLSGGIDVSKMWGHDMQTGYSNRSDLGTGLDLYAEKLTLTFEAKTKKCFTMSGTSLYKLEIDDSPEALYASMGQVGLAITEKEYPNNQRVRVCLEANVPEKLNESWYYIGEGHQFNTILRDGLNMEENKYITLIRGEKNMARFINFVHENFAQIFLKKVKNHILPDSYMKDTFSNFRLAFDKNNDLVSDSAISGTIEKFDDLDNADDQFYGSLPVKDFNVMTSPFGEKK